MQGYKSRQTAGHYSLATADDLSATGDNAIWDVWHPITVVRVMALITTLTVSTGNIIVAFDRRVLTASDTGRVNGLNSDGDAVLTIPTAAAVGKIYYQDISPGEDLNPGDQVVVEVTTAAAGGGAAGGARYSFDYIDRDEEAANLTDMVSA